LEERHHHASGSAAKDMCTRSNMIDMTSKQTVGDDSWQRNNMSPGRNIE